MTDASGKAHQRATMSIKQLKGLEPTDFFWYFLQFIDGDLECSEACHVSDRRG